MAKARGIYRCQACGGTTPQWLGRCPACGEWNSLEQETLAPVSTKPRRDGSQPVAFPEIASGDFARFTSGIAELDRVLGGGVVAGSLVLVGGDPGIGKSTLMLQMSSRLAESGRRVLYVSGEESAAQLKLRGERLGVASANLLVQAEVLLENVRQALESVRPELIVIDSIQAVYSEANQAPPGTVSQVRDAAQAMMEIAKIQNIPVFVVGHVTKDGYIAGPKVLEHMVDTVLYFEGQDSGAYRLLRAVKNRFGALGEIGVFEMQESGLNEVGDPSGLFIHGRGGEQAGTAVMAAIEGSRPLLVEIQSLVTRTTFSQPRRITTGFDQTRLAVMLAVMEKRAGVFLSSSDVVLSLVGGLRINEPAADLAIVMALASSALDRPLPSGTVCIGEVGLNGEIRPVGQMLLRLKEASRLGFERALVPQSCLAALGSVPGIKLVALQHVGEALQILKD